MPQLRGVCAVGVVSRAPDANRPRAQGERAGALGADRERLAAGRSAPPCPVPVLPAASPAPSEPPLGPKAVWRMDLATSEARRRLRDALRGQCVEVTPSPLAERCS